MINVSATGESFAMTFLFLQRAGFGVAYAW
jgi:hypothetical protein